MKDLQSWDEKDFYPCNFLSESNGQLTIFFDVVEPPDPDDYSSTEAYEQAYGAWDYRESSITEQINHNENRPDQSSITEQINSKQGVIELSHGTLGTYRKKDNYYYRYSYREGKKVRHIHLCPVRGKKNEHKDLIDCVRELITKKKPITTIVEVIELLKLHS
jgi:hypothetical protein